jgi:2,3-bisphosphoglycerate-independent phosphoglycerate mutase
MELGLKQIALIILDGWGHREDTKDNAIAEARTPFFDSLRRDYPHTLLNAGEEKVGLPKGTIGNSEIGHMVMGSGRTINTDLVRISNSIKNGEFKNILAFKTLFEHVKKNNSTLHVMGMVSPIGVHSHQDHLHAFLKLAKDEGIEKVAIHAFTDGRDSPPQGSSGYLYELEKLLADIGVGHIGTVIGRYYAMDRDKNWDRTKLAEDAIFEGKGKVHKNTKPSEVVKELYKNGELDEHFEPLIFLDSTGKNYEVKEGDGIFFLNFRTDRPRQLCYKIMERSKGKNIMLATMTEYAPDIESVVAFPPTRIEHTLAEEISRAGLSQVHIAETEKYAHVTYFFNGERPQLYPNEKHILIESRKDVRTHDMAPEMKAREIADAAIISIEEGCNFLVINFANADIVGHTANKEAILKAVEVVDHELKRIVETLLSVGGAAFITADHGNAEVNIDPITGIKHTSHTLSQVPAILTKKDVTLKVGTLADIAPTILSLYELPIPIEMTGKKLF